MSTQLQSSETPNAASQSSLLSRFKNNLSTIILGTGLALAGGAHVCSCDTRQHPDFMAPAVILFFGGLAIIGGALVKENNADSKKNIRKFNA